MEERDCVNLRLIENNIVNCQNKLSWEKIPWLFLFFASENKKVDLTISLLSRCFRLLPELFMLFIAAFLISPVQTDRSEIKWNQE